MAIFSGLSKFKASADDKINVTKKQKFDLGRGETLWEMEKMLVPAFSPFPTMFSKGYFLRVIKIQDSELCGKGLIHHVKILAIIIRPYFFVCVE